MDLDPKYIPLALIVILGGLMLAAVTDLMTSIVVISVLVITLLTLAAIRKVASRTAAMEVATQPWERIVPEAAEPTPTKPFVPIATGPAPETAAPPRSRPWIKAEPSPPATIPMPAQSPSRIAPSRAPLAESQENAGRSSIAEVKAAIERIPGGLTRELALYDSQTIAEKVARGRTKVAPDGTPLVYVMGEWYVNTPGDLDRFLKHWNG